MKKRLSCVGDQGWGWGLSAVRADLSVGLWPPDWTVVAGSDSWGSLSLFSSLQPGSDKILPTTPGLLFTHSKQNIFANII